MVGHEETPYFISTRHEMSDNEYTILKIILMNDGFININMIFFFLIKYI